MQDIEGNAIPKDMQKWAMGIYVIGKENGDPGHHDDIGISIDGAIIQDNIGSAAQACAVMLGVIYTLNLAYPKELRHYYEIHSKSTHGNGWGKAFTQSPCSKEQNRCWTVEILRPQLLCLVFL